MFSHPNLVSSTLTTCLELAAEKSSHTHIHILGRQDYLTTWQAMQTYTKQRHPKSPNQIWLLEHFPLYSAGTSSQRKDILTALDHPLHCVDRGGKITYHGPGQLMLYYLIDLRRNPDLRLKKLIQLLEQILLHILKEYHINAQTDPTARGIYYKKCKIGAIGLAVKNSSSMHGCALNVNTNLGAFNSINACGQNIQPTNIHTYEPECTQTILNTTCSAIHKYWPEPIINGTTTQQVENTYP